MSPNPASRIRPKLATYETQRAYPSLFRLGTCEKPKHARYIGRMHWLGFNTERITSVRSGLQ